MRFRAAVAALAQSAPFPQSASGGKSKQDGPYGAALGFYRGRLIQELKDLDRQ